MAIKSASILAGATVAFSGGTAMEFIDDGVTIPNGVHIVASGTSDVRLREHATFKYRPGSVDSRGNVTRSKHDVSYTVPKVDGVTGVVENTTVRLSLDKSSLMSTAEQLELRKQVAAMLLDSDFDNFWIFGSTS